LSFVNDRAENQPEPVRMLGWLGMLRQLSHCHIVEHEDNEMMRPYRIGP
jgi:hypothetical protein